jgi:hypothetical protein
MTALSLAQDPDDFEQTAFTVTPLAPSVSYASTASATASRCAGG